MPAAAIARRIMLFLAGLASDYAQNSVSVASHNSGSCPAWQNPAPCATVHEGAWRRSRSACDVAPVHDETVRGVGRVRHAGRLEPDREVGHLRAGYPLDGLAFDGSQIGELQIDVEDVGRVVKEFRPAGSASPRRRGVLPVSANDLSTPW